MSMIQRLIKTYGIFIKQKILSPLLLIYKCSQVSWHNQVLQISMHKSLAWCWQYTATINSRRVQPVSYCLVCMPCTKGYACLSLVIFPFYIVLTHSWNILTIMLDRHRHWQIISEILALPIPIDCMLTLMNKLFSSFNLTTFYNYSDKHN